MYWVFYLILHCYCSYILWGDEIFGRHALLSRGWGSQDKRSIEPVWQQCRIDQGRPLNFVLQLTAPWRFDSSPYSFNFSHVLLMPSRFFGEAFSFYRSLLMLGSY